MSSCFLPHYERAACPMRVFRQIHKIYKGSVGAAAVPKNDTQVLKVEACTNATATVLSQKNKRQSSRALKNGVASVTATTVFVLLKLQLVLVLVVLLESSDPLVATIVVLFDVLAVHK